ncbi:MAG: DNA primase small subunit PriS [Candidatus Nezhaarchaeota archaeon]|nr:DNA primase small subunit PriS [Candidatus Nezhaarchaeota archaeon]MCX8141883.1 DNA primase small subunit PriS [Candidatus Nezhaarchaeota archaeon]MDW8050336.1 DNA primase small subunit PriS [Nitrososphaerota archaeon]
MRSFQESEDFVKRLFKSYYLKWRGDPPREYHKREYAFMLSRKGEMIRHISFENWNEMKEFLVKNVPLHVFYSSAYYLQPSAPEMEAKDWIGADLVFDIDVDHLYTSCKEDHDNWMCLDCNFNGKGVAPEECPSCSSKKIESKAWFCEKCIDVAKEEVIKLVEDFLIKDFGFSPSEIEIVFSGRRGFHVHVESDIVRELDQRARREIVDYVKGTGLVLREKKKKLLIPPLNAQGWPGRIARGVYEIINSRSTHDVAKLLCLKKGKGITEIEGQLKKILSKLEGAEGYWMLEGEACKVWLKIAEKAVLNMRCEVDERVTTDIKRLIRLPETLHGNTGLIVSKIKMKDLETFDPYVHAVAFRKDEVKVKIVSMPKIKFLGQEWGPYRDTIVEVPLGLAVYLICSGNAIISDEERRHHAKGDI